MYHKQLKSERMRYSEKKVKTCDVSTTSMTTSLEDLHWIGERKTQLHARLALTTHAEPCMPGP